MFDIGWTEMLVIAVVMSIGFAMLSRLVWLRSIRGYTSASS